MRVGVVAHKQELVNTPLAEAWRGLGLDAAVLSPQQALETLRRGDVAILRLDVLPTVDGVEPGFEVVPGLRRAGVHVLNPPWALLGAHDKLETARRLEAAGIPHPRTVHVGRPGGSVPLEPPVVVKPRHGSWGRDVALCATRAELERRLEEVAALGWFRRHGALVQELVPARRRDLRLIVAAGTVVGGTAREAGPGEWRTNVSLGGRLVPEAPDEAARRLAVRAAAALGCDLVGVDLLPLPAGGHVVLELNGAVDFDERYSLPGTDVYAAAAAALRLLPEHGREAA